MDHRFRPDRQVVRVIEKLAAEGGLCFSADGLGMLGDRVRQTDLQPERVAGIYDAIWRGFFGCAARGLPLVAEELVARRFKRGLQENYPEASESFLNFARTYWTLRVLVLALLETHTDDSSLDLGERLLCQLEQEIGPVFFPFPGPKKIDPATREAFQRQLIEESGANIDIEDFMGGNPILARDRA